MELQTAATVGVAAVTVKQVLLRVSVSRRLWVYSYGTMSTATIPPSPSGTVATPFGTTQSAPSTSRLK